MTVVWLKDSGQAVTCLDCKYRGEILLEALPKPKLKWQRARTRGRTRGHKNLIVLLHDSFDSSCTRYQLVREDTRYSCKKILVLDSTLPRLGISSNGGRVLWFRGPAYRVARYGVHTANNKEPIRPRVSFS